MWRCFALAFAAAIASQAPIVITHAQAQKSTIPCDAFQKNADGSWTVLQTTFIEGPQVRVQEGAILPPGDVILGYDVTDIIAKACPNATVGSPATVAPATTSPAPTQPPQAPQVPLSRYADANGNIGIERLTCGQLNDASAEDADLLLAWYGGLYDGLAKRRTVNTINMARLRYLIRGVVDYCKANRDKSLTQVMELMLK
jgi:HdeA/HdeB family